MRIPIQSQQPDSTDRGRRSPFRSGCRRRRPPGAFRCALRVGEARERFGPGELQPIGGAGLEIGESPWSR